jgi:hypothetical protein
MNRWMQPDICINRLASWAFLKYWGVGNPPAYLSEDATRFHAKRSTQKVNGIAKKQYRYWYRFRIVHKSRAKDLAIMIILYSTAAEWLKSCL